MRSGPPHTKRKVVKPILCSVQAGVVKKGNARQGIKIVQACDTATSRDQEGLTH
jgi:hypothetical protein